MQEDITIGTGTRQEKPSRTFPVAVILTLIVGFFDAYTYYGRGGVFANAQTGNIVKLVLALGEDTDPLVFLLPIGTFVVKKTSFVAAVLLRYEADSAPVSARPNSRSLAIVWTQELSRSKSKVT